MALQKKQSFQELFLKEFVKTIIEHTKPSNIPNLEAEDMHQKTFIKIPTRGEDHFTPSVKIMPMNIQPQMPIPGRQSQGIRMPILPPVQTNVPNAGNLGLGKIDQIMQDPAVISLECPGPGKNILVNRSGSIQTTPITLSQEEINETMKQISERTKIPLISGLFKAALGNLIITAVISEFVGTRFILQKRSPYMQRR